MGPVKIALGWRLRPTIAGKYRVEGKRAEQKVYLGTECVARYSMYDLLRAVQRKPGYWR